MTPFGNVSPLPTLPNLALPLGGGGDSMGDPPFCTPAPTPPGALGGSVFLDGGRPCAGTHEGGSMDTNPSVCRVAPGSTWCQSALPSEPAPLVALEVGLPPSDDDGSVSILGGPCMGCLR